MSKPYEPPVITKLQGGLMNKFGRSTAASIKVRREIDRATIDDLVAKHGSPLFVFSERRIREKYREAYDAFSHRYPNILFAWSYKTNYLGAICCIMHQEGAVAEVVSEMEYGKARAARDSRRPDHLQRPRQAAAVLETAIRDGSTINVDHLDEIGDLETVADKLGRKLQVGLRLNLDAGVYPLWSRFGFNLESGQALNAVKRMVAGRRSRVNGLHCHIGTFILDPAAYARQIEKMVRFAGELESQFGFAIEYLNIGGGFPSHSRLKATYLPADVGVPASRNTPKPSATPCIAACRPASFPGSCWRRAGP